MYDPFASHINYSIDTLNNNSIFTLMTHITLAILLIAATALITFEVTARHHHDTMLALLPSATIGQHIIDQGWVTADGEWRVVAVEQHDRCAGPTPNECVKCTVHHHTTRRTTGVWLITTGGTTP
jgi:hypothetical protein